MKCAFTGHRQFDDDFDIKLFERGLICLIETYGVDTFYDGMARGFDLVAAQKVIELKRSYDLKLIACIPFGGQIDTIKGEERKVYEEVLQKCDDVKILSAEYYPGCMYARNRYMVDNADCVYAYFHGEKGGTKYTVDYASRNGKQLFII